jgi:chromosome segregation protein
MYLKKLTIQGFKSFVNRTPFEFPAGLTAIVGPNGSGKSNVADAVRWVLGEQSNRLLRARRQEDVIFAGTRERGAVGMAEVLLTLDNADRWLPVEFAEVEIGRRLYRDGESEYLLNGQKVRLRDVADLLMKAQVGQNSYAIMGQGLVDEVLAMSPEERRSFFDEAADVKRFRVRIQQAQDRLAATRENMERVTLIVNELTPRLGQLARQAERAAEHARLAGQLEALLRVYYAHRWNAAQNRLVGARARLDQAHAATKAASGRLDALRQQLRALGEEIRRRREAIARSEAQRSEREARLREAEQALALERERRQMIEARYHEVLAEADALEAEHAALRGPADSDPVRIAELDAAVRDAETKFAGCRAALSAAEAEWTAAVAALEELRGRAEADTRRRSGIVADIERARSRLAQLEREAEAATPKRTTLLVELRGYGARYLALAQRVAEAELQLDSARENARHARERLGRVQDEVRQFEEAAKRDLRELDRLEGRLEALRRVQAEHDGLAAGTRNALLLGGHLREALAPAEPPAVPGVLGLLASNLQVPEGLEVAINAALESRLHAVIVDSEESALEAIARLREGRHGRAQFIAVDSFKHAYPLNLQREQGVLGVAARLVRAPRELQPLVDTLLGRVIVCEDDAAARRMLKRSLGPCVTLAGTFFEATGLLHGGATGADEGPFARQRELAELPAEIEAARRRTEANARRLTDAQASFQRLEMEARESERLDTAARRDLDAGRAELERERSRLHRLRQEMGAFRLRLRDIEGERARQARALAAAEEAMAQLARNAAGRGEGLQAAESAMHGAAARREAALRAVSDAGARRAAAEGERRHLANAQEQQAQAAQRVATQAQARRAQADQLRAEASQAAVRIEALAAALAALLAAAGTAADTEPDRHELERLEAHERQVQESFAGAQNDLLEADRARLDLESEVARTGSEIEEMEIEMVREGLRPDRRGGVISIEESPAASPIGGGADVELSAMREQIEEIRRRIRRLGPINTEAPEDYRETSERHAFLTGQLADLEAAEVQLRQAIAELSVEIKDRFETTFQRVNGAFGEYFAAFFGGGSASLSLTDAANPAESGVEIDAQPPGKKLKNLALLSGGERSLTAVALLFALLSVNPAPFCVLDEVDAALDEANVGRFVGSLRKLAERTQFIVITHNRRTVEAADAIYGVSMNSDGISRVLSLRLEDVPAN